MKSGFSRQNYVFYYYIQETRKWSIDVPAVFLLPHLRIMKVLIFDIIVERIFPSIKSWNFVEFLTIIYRIWVGILWYCYRES